MDLKLYTNLSVQAATTMSVAQSNLSAQNSPTNLNDPRTPLNVRKSIGITDAKVKLGQIVDEVYYQGDTILLEKSGKPVAIVVPVDMYRLWQAKRETSFAMIRQVQERVQDKFTEEASMNLALEAQQAVRKEPNSNT
jgi:prevent-host-death family protein